MALWIIILFFVAIQPELLGPRFMSYFGINWKNRKFYQRIYSSLQVLWIMAAAIFRIPIPVLFAGVYLLQFFIRSDEGTVNKNTWCCRIMISALFSSSYLISHALANLFMLLTGTINEITYARIFTLIGAKALMIIFYLLPWNAVIYQRKAKIVDTRRETLFFQILLCFLLYVFMDACLGMDYSNGIFVPLLLINGNMLLIVLYLLLMRQEYLVAESQYMEEEKRRLIAETALEEYITQRQERLVERDSLTGAYSRRFAIERMNAMNKNSELLSIVYIDLDGLKQINDTCGHGAGDQYLKSFAAELEKRLGMNDTVARIGGDEFLVLLPGCEPAEAAKQIDRIRTELSHPDNGAGAIPFSFGVASGSDNPDQAIKLADKEMYLDKKRAEGGRV